MKAFDVIESMSNPSMRQLVFFYELCKAGVVRFDMGNPAHAELLDQMHALMRKDMDREAYSTLEKTQKEARQRAYVAILCQIVSHIMPLKRKGIRDAS